MAVSRKLALITGGSRGIGFGVAKALAAGGFDLAVCGRRDAASVSGAIEELESVGSGVTYWKGDVADLSDHALLLDHVRQRFGRLDVLVNNAGVAPLLRTDILHATADSFDRLIDINLRGPYFLTQAAARWMIEQRKADAEFRGCIVNVSSISATTASVNRGDYCISKAGVAMATKLWAVRLADFGIDVYEIRPGIIETDMTAGVKEKYDKLIADGLTVERRWGKPADVGKAVAMLARGDLPYATGQVLLIDGGFHLERL